MDIRNMDATNGLNNDDWTFLIFLLLMQDLNNKNETWDQFEQDLIYKNRFSSESPIVEELRKRSEQATRYIPNKAVFYRARSFKHSGFRKLLKYYLQESDCTKDEIEKIISNWPESEKQLTLLSQMFSEVEPGDFGNTEDTLALINAQRKWKRYVRFKGYNAADSTAPEPERISNGRANPDHIRYLYLCEDSVTPIYEIRPIIGEQVSVAKFQLQKEIKVYDLTLDIADPLEDSEFKWPSLYNTIGHMFSKPFNGEAKQYISTQYLAELIKRMGFDGLRFNSSLNKGGINVVLFNPDLCKAISSELVDVESINITLREPIIYKIGQMITSTENTEKH